MTACGIKCDVCDYEDNSVKKEDYKLWLNKPCPKCGANLLTKKDMQTINIMLTVHKWIGWIRFPSFYPSIQVHVEMNGTGEISIKEKL